MQLDDVRGARRADERDEPPSAQHQAPDVAIAAVVRILEAERALESEPPIFPPMQTQSRGVHGLVEPLHARRTARIATECFGPFRSPTPRAPVRERECCDDHHNQ